MDLPGATSQPTRRHAGKRILLLKHGRDTEPLRAPHDRAGGIAPRADDDLRLLVPEHALRGPHRTQPHQRKQRVAPPLPPVQRLDGQEMEPKGMMRQNPRLDAALCTDEYDVVSLICGNSSERDGGHQVTTGTAAVDEEFHNNCGLAIADCGFETS